MPRQGEHRELEAGEQRELEAAPAATCTHTRIPARLPALNVLHQPPLVPVAKQTPAHLGHPHSLLRLLLLGPLKPLQLRLPLLPAQHEWERRASRQACRQHVGYGSRATP